MRATVRVLLTGDGFSRNPDLEIAGQVREMIA
jgi:hypothetical protein